MYAALCIAGGIVAGIALTVLVVHLIAMAAFAKGLNW